MRITILGAGDMGSAIAVPANLNGHEVRLWGTRYDHHIVDLLRAGEPHPRLMHPIPKAVQIFSSDELDLALKNTEIAVLAVSSNAVDSILELAAPWLSDEMIFVSMAKGLIRTNDDRVSLICYQIAERTGSSVIGVGGPSKANEVGLDLPTAVVFGGREASAVEIAARAFRTRSYSVRTTDDLIGVELGAALKNAYAIAVGVATGMEELSGLPHQNFKAALIQEAVVELAEISAACGGRRETIYGLAGVGDIAVTVAAGRNRLLGELLGRNIPVADALASITATGITIEGYAAVELGYHLIQQVMTSADQFPLLSALYHILYQEAAVFESLWNAVGR